MPMFKLNPAAPAFVPSSSPSQHWEDLDSSEVRFLVCLCGGGLCEGGVYLSTQLYVGLRYASIGLGESRALFHGVRESLHHLETAAHTTAPTPQTQDHISQSELDELEAVEDWCAAMASIEEEEAQYLIDLALDLAPPERVAEVEHEALERTR